MSTLVDDFLSGVDADAPLWEAPGELVVDKATGQVRQAGAELAEGAAIVRFRALAQANLYVFCKGVLGLTRLTPGLHAPVCAWLTRIPPLRKALIIPRDHLKSSIGARGMPLHMIVQPEDANIYLPGHDGANVRVLLAGETATLAEKNLRWIENATETNDVLRALWPHRVWDNPHKQTKRWNAQEALFPRSVDFTESTIETAGVDTATTGRHYNVLIKDDLTTLIAANSPIIMQTAIGWHRASRDLADDPETLLEFNYGTKWTTHDWPADLAGDVTVETMRRSIVENGQPIFPEMFSLDTIAALRANNPKLFPLIYMNDEADPDLVDFDMRLVRTYGVDGGAVTYDADARDARLAQRFLEPGRRASAPEPPRGTLLYDFLADQAARRGDELRAIGSTPSLVALQARRARSA